MSSIAYVLQHILALYMVYTNVCYATNLGSRYRKATRNVVALSENACRAYQTSANQNRGSSSGKATRTLHFLNEIHGRTRNFCPKQKGATTISIENREAQCHGVIAT